MPAATLRAHARSVKGRSVSERCHWHEVSKTCAKGYTPVVAYYRMSTDEQEKSIASQRDELASWLEREKYCVLREYIDEGISGNDTEKRIAFLQMIDDASDGTVDVKFVVCWHLDRFGRFDILDAGHWTYPLRKAGVPVKTPTGDMVWDTYEGRLIYTVQQENNHGFLKNISRNVTRGKLSAAKEGRWAGGPTPLGYRVDRTINPVNGKTGGTGKLVLGDPEEIKMVTTIFNLADSGSSMRAIAKQMTEQFGAHPKSGCSWNSTSIANVLHNPLFTGDFIFPKTSHGKYFCIRNGEVSDQVGETGTQIFLPANHPPIIEYDLYERAIKKADKRRFTTTPLPNGGNFLLSGLVYCAACGGRMTGRNAHLRLTSGVVRYPTYRCNRYAHYAECRPHYVRQDELVEHICQALEDWAANEESQGGIQEIFAAIHDEAAKVDPVEALATRKADIEKQIQTAKKRLATADESIWPILEEMLVELVAELRKVEASLAAARRPASHKIDMWQQRYEAAVNKMGDLRRLLTGDPLVARELLAELIERVDVDIDTEPWGTERFRYKLKSGVVTINRALLDLSGLEDEEENSILSFQDHAANSSTDLTDSSQVCADNLSTVSSRCCN